MNFEADVAGEARLRKCCDDYDQDYEQPMTRLTLHRIAVPRREVGSGSEGEEKLMPPSAKVLEAYLRLRPTMDRIEAAGRMADALRLDAELMPSKF